MYMLIYFFLFKAELMEKRLIAAHKLISGLSTEKVRWTHELEVLAERYSGKIINFLFSRYLAENA